MFRLFVAAALVLVLSSCDRTGGYNKADFADDTVSLKVDGNIIYQYYAGNGQLAYNKGRKEFRAGSDNMSDYFVLKLASLPGREEEVINGSLTWTTSDNTKTLKSVDFKVMQIKNQDTYWLWNSKQKIALVVKELK